MRKRQNTVQKIIDKLQWKPHLGLVERFVPYPTRAMRINISFRLFPWWKPSWNKRELTEHAKSQGETVWWFRWLWVQISYSRWV